MLFFCYLSAGFEMLVYADSHMVNNQHRDVNSLLVFVNKMLVCDAGSSCINVGSQMVIYQHRDVNYMLFFCYLSAGFEMLVYADSHMVNNQHRDVNSLLVFVNKMLVCDAGSSCINVGSQMVIYQHRDVNLCWFLLIKCWLGDDGSC